MQIKYLNLTHLLFMNSRFRFSFKNNTLQMSYNLLQTDREKIRKLWGKSNEDVQDYIRILKEWLQTQNHLPEIPDDNTIEFILTNCKYRVEKAKKNLDGYYTIRTIMPEIFKGHHPTKTDALKRVSKMWIYAPMPELTPEMHRILAFRYAKDEEIPLNLDETTAHEVNISEIRMHEDLSMGDVYFIDCTGLTLSHVTKYTPTAIRKYLIIFEKVYSSRGKSFHVVNYPPFALQVMNIAKMVVKKKIFDRVKLHPDMESLYECVPRELLPVEYGGKEKSLDELQELWFQKLRDYEKRFDKLEEMTIDESLRPEPLVNSDVLGYYGNFKKIDVD